MSEPNSKELRRFRRAQQLELIYKQAEIALLASVVCAGILAYLVHDAVTIESLVRWGQIMGAVAAIRYLVIYAFRNTDVRAESIAKWHTVFIGTLVLSGAAWGSATFLLAPSVNSVHQAIVLLFIMGFVAGAAAAFNGDRFAFAAFAVPAIAFPMLNLFIYGDPVTTKFAAVLGLFLVFLLASAERSYRAYKHDFAVQLDRQRLAKALHEEKENFKQLATDLESRVKMRTEQLSDLNEKLQAEVFERREAEYAARSRKARFTAAFENAPLGMLIAHKATGEIVKANAAACELLGYPTDELTKMRLFSLLCPSERDAGIDLFQSDSTSIDRRFLHRRGHVIWGRTSIGTMSGYEETDGLVVIQIQDLSELKTAHDRLTSLGGAFGTAFEATPIPTAIIDTCGRITSMNPRMRTVLGFGYDDINDLALATLVESNDQASAKLADFFSGRVGHIETEVVLFKGQPNEIDTTISVSRIGEGSSSDAHAVLHIDVALAALNAEDKTTKQSSNVVPLERRA